MVAAVLATLLILTATVSALRFGVGAVPFGAALAAAVGELLSSNAGDATTTVDSAPTGSDGSLLTHGVASGDISATTAVVWTRLNGPGKVIVSAGEETAAGEALRSVLFASAAMVDRGDHTAAVRLDGLRPDTAYIYEVIAQRPIGNGEMFQVTRPGLRGRFRTAPEGAAHRDFSFVFSGDVAGSGFCRSPEAGYPIFDAMARLQPDFFIATGDMIYADNPCPAVAPDGKPNVRGGFPSVGSRTLDWTNYEQMREVYFQHWHYNRADLAFQRFLRDTPMYVMWDDHEIINDGGGAWSYHNVTNANRAGYPTLVSAARDAFFAYAPIARDPADPNRLYRRVSWGTDADLFLLDTRSYRSRNDLADIPENEKTMLGRDQLAWLKAGLAESTATWKIVASSVPLSIPTGGLAAAVIGRDGWANGTSWDYSSQTGFERELLDLLRSVDDAAVRNIVFLSGDAHQAVEIRYATDPNGDGRQLVFHEIVAGPLSAPTTRDNSQLDPTLNPMQLYREAGIYNFGYVRIERGSDGLAHFVADIRDGNGQARTGSRLDLVPAR